MTSNTNREARRRAGGMLLVGGILMAVGAPLRWSGGYCSECYLGTTDPHIGGVQLDVVVALAGLAIILGAALLAGIVARRPALVAALAMDAVIGVGALFAVVAYGYSGLTPREGAVLAAAGCLFAIGATVTLRRPRGRDV